MPKQKTITVYQYSELSEAAKERAREWFLSAGAGDSWAWDSTNEDAAQVGIKLDGIGRGGSMSGALTLDFTQVMAQIIENHGEMCDTHQTAKRYQADYLKIDEGETGDEAREDLEEEFRREILEDYRIMCEKEQEYQASEEYISEMMEANGYEFTENGKRV
jgi:hypothetical protein